MLSNCGHEQRDGRWQREESSQHYTPAHIKPSGRFPLSRGEPPRKKGTRRRRERIRMTYGILFARGSKGGVRGREGGREVGDPVIRPLIILTPQLRGRPLFGKLCVAQEE